ncbi:MAG: MarR family EPS-associated transcriptional regulator [Nitrosospira sp.]|nr:MarR family EPS-associated transcriptional regulator [Nitrosospira sp.]
MPSNSIKILPDTPLREENHLKVLRLLESNPHMSQRDLSEALGVSLGKTNYCIKALLDKGLIKMLNFRSNKNKLAYAYLLTPAGVEEKACITVRFLKYKVQEYERLRVEIVELRREAARKGKLGNEHE